MARTAASLTAWCAAASAAPRRRARACARREDGAHRALLELVDRRGARATRGGDHVPQLREMASAAARERRGSFDGAKHELLRDTPRESEMHARVDERLHQQEDVGRTGAGERGRHVDHALLLDLDLLAERAEDRLRAVALIALDARGRAPRGDAHPDLRRRVRHRAHDRRVVEALAQHRERRAGHDGDNELIGAQLPAHLAKHRRQHLRLHGQHDDVGTLGRVGVRRECLHAELFRELRAPLAARPGDEDVRRRHQMLVEEPADHRLRHRSAADEREPLSLKRHPSPSRSSRRLRGERASRGV